MSSRKKRDYSQDLDESDLRSTVVSPQKEPNETLFQFFKKKTKFNIDKNYKTNLQNSKRPSSVQPQERESHNSNMQFLKKLNEAISPNKAKSQINNFTSPPKPNLTLTTETKNLSFDSGMNATWTSKGADDRRYSSFIERSSLKDEEFSQTADNFNRSGSKKYNTNPLRSSGRKVQFSESKYLTDKSEIRESDNNADDEDLAMNTFETTSRASQISTIQKKLITMGTQLEDSLDKVKHFSDQNMKKCERLIKYIENNLYFDSSTLKNITAECKVTTLSLGKALNNSASGGFALKLIKEFDDLHRKERESQVEEAKNQLRHAMNLQKTNLEKKHFEYEVEIERLRHELIIHQENTKAKELEKKREVPKSLEVEDLQNQNSQLQYKLDKLHKENSILREEYLEIQRRLERETEYLKEELAKALHVVDLPLNKNPTREKENTSGLKEAFKAYRGESGSKRRSKTIEEDDEPVLKPKRGETPNRGGTPKRGETPKKNEVPNENLRTLKYELQDLKSEKLILTKENETLLQRLTDQIMMERDMKRILSKNEELQHKLKGKKTECENLWKAMREIKAHMIKVSKLNDLFAVLRKFSLEDKAKVKFESRYN